MIQTAFNGMIAILLARFMLNAVPHALELLPPPRYNSLEEYQRKHRAVRVVRTYPPRKGLIPRLPEEARGDILFLEYVQGMAKYEALSEEDVRTMWEGYEAQRGRGTPG